MPTPPVASHDDEAIRSLQQQCLTLQQQVEEKDEAIFELHATLASVQAEAQYQVETVTKQSRMEIEKLEQHSSTSQQPSSRFQKPTIETMESLGWEPPLRLVQTLDPSLQQYSDLQLVHHFVQQCLDTHSPGTATNRHTYLNSCKFLQQILRSSARARHVMRQGVLTQTTLSTSPTTRVAIMAATRIRHHNTTMLQQTAMSLLQLDYPNTKLATSIAPRTTSDPATTTTTFSIHQQPSYPQYVNAKFLETLVTTWPLDCIQLQLLQILLDDAPVEFRDWSHARLCHYPTTTTEEQDHTTTEEQDRPTTSRPTDKVEPAPIPRLLAYAVDKWLASSTMARRTASSIPNSNHDTNTDTVPALSTTTPQQQQQKQQNDDKEEVEVNDLESCLVIALEVQYQTRNTHHRLSRHVLGLVLDLLEHYVLKQSSLYHHAPLAHVILQLLQQQCTIHPTTDGMRWMQTQMVQLHHSSPVWACSAIGCVIQIFHEAILLPSIPTSTEPTTNQQQQYPSTMTTAHFNSKERVAEVMTSITNDCIRFFHLVLRHVQLERQRAESHVPPKDFISFLSVISEHKELYKSACHAVLLQESNRDMVKLVRLQLDEIYMDEEEEEEWKNQ